MDEQKPKAKKEIPVRVISAKGKSALVEWYDKKHVRRSFLPIEKVGEKVEQELLEAAPAYGIPWADSSILTLTPEILEDALHDAGIWTYDDLRLNTKVVIGVIQALIGVHLGALVEFAEANKLNEVK